MNYIKEKLGIIKRYKFPRGVDRIIFEYAEEPIKPELLFLRELLQATSDLKYRIDGIFFSVDDFDLKYLSTKYKGRNIGILKYDFDKELGMKRALLYGSSIKLCLVKNLEEKKNWEYYVSNEIGNSASHFIYPTIHN